jgi:activating signal cointegrator complex subunit 1
MPNLYFMKPFWGSRGFCARKAFISLPHAHKFRHIMTDTKGTTSPLKPGPEKQPTLTHFLCLPLVNSVSISQLENSIKEFKSAHVSDPGTSEFNDQTNPSHLGLPEKAFRPLGTLHLTLGVMSLHSKERLEQATSLLQSLDLASLVGEAERIATHSQHHGGQSRLPHTSQESNTNMTSASQFSFTISLESLHALPRAKSATVLHASPVDPTGRLHPFCVMLRDKFIEAGLIQIEADKKPKKEHSSNGLTQETPQISQPIPISGDAPSHRPASPKNLDPYTAAMTRRPKSRPLLLHATLVNTIYVRGRQKNHNKNAKHKTSSKRMTFDARNLVPQSTDKPSSAGSISSAPSHNYIWARDIPLDTICICEMGAKRLLPSAIDDHGLSERLGEQYLTVAQRSLKAT